MAETIIYDQAHSFLQCATQCVREYQEIIVQQEAAWTKRNIAQAWIDVGALAISLVLTCGGAMVAQGVLRGQGLYARFALTSLQRAQSAARSTRAVRTAQIALNNPAIQVGKQLAVPQFIIRSIQELPVRLAISIPRTAAATVLFGPLVAASAYEQGDPNFVIAGIVGKLGALRRPIQHAAAIRDTVPEVVVSEEAIRRKYDNALKAMGAELSALVTLAEPDRARFIAALDHSVLTAIDKDPRLSELADEQQLYLRSKALLDRWFSHMQDAEKLEGQQRQKITALGQRVVAVSGAAQAR
ncbi:MAG: hypothetical protein IPK81_24765 [Rhodospirillales bacterium]|nr:MAG: hypothetical protein IPK81_24765 [Rhodospirillales bacterium]